MPILAGDIKLVASQVMGDVSEGGGAPTSTVILDGASNAIFPDISELDRAGGRVNLRKLHMSVQTADTDTYLGSNIIVAEPPTDPNVSVTLFTTNSVFDTRAEASLRVESYLNQGPMWGGFLFEDHLKGQRVIQLFQRPTDVVPNVGQTLVLIQNEGLGNQVIQYIRTTSVSSVVRLFYDEETQKDYPAAIVSCGLSDALRYGFAGSPPTRKFAMAVGKTKTRDTVVADAGTYVGVSRLSAPVPLGSFTVTANSVFTQLVPSAQTEVPISDVRTNGLSNALVSTGGSISQEISIGFTTTQRMFVGGPIYPGSLSITRAGVTLVDAGGLLTNAGVEVGQVDYDNGIVTLSVNVWGGSASTHTVTFVPAAVPDLISSSHAIRVTQESRSLSYVVTMGTIPVARTMSISYLAQGRWYVLRDNGAGALKGASSAFGVGTLSYTTGSLSVTLGALPDVGSAIVILYYSDATTQTTSNALMVNGGRLFVPMNTAGALSEEPGPKAIKPGALSITWTDGVTPRTATDNGTGLLTGDATGSVNYSQGVVKISPNTLPAADTLFTLIADGTTSGTATGILINGGSLGAVNITPGSVSFVAGVVFSYTSSSWRLDFSQRTSEVTVQDDLAGNLYFMEGSTKTVCGTVDYLAGVITVAPQAVTPRDRAGPVVHEPNYYSGGQPAMYAPWTGGWNEAIDRGISTFSRSLTFVARANVRYSNTIAASNTVAITVPQYLARFVMVPKYALKGVGFKVGTTRYQQLTDGTLLKDINPMTGGGTPAGSVSGAIGVVVVSSWVAGVSSLVQDARALLAPPTVGVEAPFSAFSSVFRTASSPLRPGSLSVLGTMQDGTTFNVTAGLDGKINGTRVKGRVNYEFGLVELFFVNPNGDPAIVADLAHLGIAGLTTAPADLAMLTTLRYNAVSFSYLPLDAALLGIDPVRLPSDGKVPIFRAGGFAVVGHSASITATVSNAQVIDCARVRLSRVRVIGANGLVINTGYTANLEAGTVTFNNVTGYSQPVKVEHRIEDMAVVREAQINGEITFTRPMTHNYPLGSYVSSALVAQDLKARVSIFFDQATWDGVTWVDTLVGNSATATFNNVLAPVVVTNAGSVTERWALRFTNTSTFEIIGEHVGVLGTGSINTATAPINPATNSPYFTIPALGWGIGWSVGNVVRLNTVGAMFPVWVVRTIQQGAESVQDDSFTLLVRGDVDRA